MNKLLVQIAPQRSTQYLALASHLAPIELQLSGAGKFLSAVEPLTLCQQPYLVCELTQPLTHVQLAELETLATVAGVFDYFDQLGDVEGPLLRPLETPFSPFLPADLISTRRYTGKTNELFTHFLVNLAKFSSDFADVDWSKLHVFDPLAGGGTTLFTALVLGAHAAGVEQNKKSAHGTATFLKKYLQDQRIKFAHKEENLNKKKAARWWFELPETGQKCLIAKGEISQSAELLAGFKKPHFIVADLPYGIQHKGGLDELLSTALPIWQNILRPGGTLVFAWDATRSTRKQMVEFVESVCDLTILKGELYEGIAHQVDRAIKRRDVLVARKP